jgi:hypothetical protein
MWHVDCGEGVTEVHTLAGAVVADQAFTGRAVLGLGDVPAAASRKQEAVGDRERVGVGVERVGCPAARVDDLESGRTRGQALDDDVPAA